MALFPSACAYAIRINMTLINDEIQHLILIAIDVVNLGTLVQKKTRARNTKCNIIQLYHIMLSVSHIHIYIYIILITSSNQKYDPISHCLWLGHETTVCAVCLSIYILSNNIMRWRSTPKVQTSAAPSLKRWSSLARTEIICSKLFLVPCPTYPENFTKSFICFSMILLRDTDYLRK